MGSLYNIHLLSLMPNTEARAMPHSYKGCGSQGSSGQLSARVVPWIAEADGMVAAIG